MTYTGSVLVELLLFMMKCVVLLLMLASIQWCFGRPIGYRGFQEESMDFEYSENTGTDIGDYNFSDDYMGPWVKPIYIRTARNIGSRQCTGLICKWRQQSYSTTPVPQFFGPLEHVPLAGG